MTIDRAIRTFSSFMNNSWTIVKPLLMDRDYTSNEDSLNDWLQVNWEILVERKVLKTGDYLEVYGDGADFNGASSRMVDAEALPNFKVTVVAKMPIYDFLNCEEVTLCNSEFNKLVGFSEGFYILEPLFNYVLINDNDKGIERVVGLDNIEFGLENL